MHGFLSRAKYVVLVCVLLTLVTIVRQLAKTGHVLRRPAAVDVDVEELALRRPIVVTGVKLESERAPPVSGGRYRVAVGGAITSKGADVATPDRVRSLPLFWQLLPSFCRTASPGYDYHFYFGYDRGDVLADETIRTAVERAFEHSVGQHCGHLRVGRLRLIRCEHDGRPAWAQNDAMMVAYLDGVDFFYRLNDDTLPVEANWTDTFVQALASLDPPFVGVVGPTCSLEPPDIMSHDFVHRRHVDIFGFYYPRAYTDWYADTWITYVYKPARSVKLANVTVHHSESMGKRYTVRESGEEVRQNTLRLADRYSYMIKRYIEAKFLPREQPQRAGLGLRVISMCLYGSKPRYVFGVIRNAQLMSVIYPSWLLRVYYHPRPESGSPEPQNERLYVADNVLDTLRRLGVELVPVTDPELLRSPEMWRYLVFDDYGRVEFALVRNADARITEREARLVNEWLAADMDHSLHCIRDHPIQGITPLMDGLWGGMIKSIRILMQSNMSNLIRNYLRTDRTYVERLHGTNDFLLRIWNGTYHKAYCHDSVTCRHWSSSHPARRLPEEQWTYVGRKFDAFDDGVTLSDRHYVESPECISDEDDVS